MAQNSPQLDMQVLHDLRQRFPEIPEGVVSQCMLQKFPSHLFNVTFCNDFICNAIALLLHQRARMERLAKQLKLEKEELEQLKAEVNSMEHDLMQRRLRRVSCTTAIPRPEEMTRLRSMNRQLQINVDCTLKEVDLLQSRGIDLIIW
ncbi:hypothetical protein J1605_006511 [Eschrichtius robustus]|uniref:CUE domain-containing protein n=1 Tax=Eschrichtius robustus TaxID=9764 RepID=A0AB34H5H9_ESCRO|nr:hypothetical protein J1605_006511 [Eschrichtius robustus]